MGRATFARLVTSLISRLVGWFSRLEFAAPVQSRLINAYCRLYRVDSAEASKEILAYKSLAQFFTRDIRSELRPLGQGSLLSPVDGLLRSCGKVQAGQICDVKGQNYSLSELLGDAAWACTLADCFFFNFYLSPRDCHHVFCPLHAKISRISNIAGALWPVNDLGLRFIPKLFVSNERVAFGLENEKWGDLALIMIGALNVGKLEVSCQKGQSLQKGQKMGTFWLGSSVILLCPQAAAKQGVAQSCGPVKFAETLLP